VEEIRLRSKREAIKDQRKKQAEFRNRLEQRVKQRKYYRKKHPRRYKGRKRGRKPIRLNERFNPEILDNGDTGVELLTRSRGTTEGKQKRMERYTEDQGRIALLFIPEDKRSV
jgi:hypothetical protein